MSAGVVVVACSHGTGTDGAGFYIADDAGPAAPAPTSPGAVLPIASATDIPPAASGEGGPSASGDAGSPSASGDPGEGEPGAAAGIAAAGPDGGPVPTGADAPGTGAVTPLTPAAVVAPTPDAATPAVGGTAGAPTLGGCPIFPADSPWNTRVDDPQAYPVHPNSATYIANMSPGTHLHPDWGDWTSSKYGIPWETVPATQVLVPMTFDVSDESDPGPYPFPTDARVEGGSNSGGDMHVIVVDTGSCTLYESYASTYVGPGWSCSSGAKFDLTSNALRPDGWTSADAAGLPILPGLVRVSEVQAGAIHHALRFTVSRTQQGYIHPATHAAGSSNTSLPPMGLRVRLKSSFDVSKFTGAAAVILTAMQQYGLILADNGSNWFVSGDSDDAWTPLMDGVNTAFSQVTANDFEAVQTGPILQ